MHGRRQANTQEGTHLNSHTLGLVNPTQTDLTITDIPTQYVTYWHCDPEIKRQRIDILITT